VFIEDEIVAIPHSKPTLGHKEITAVTGAIQSGRIARGDRVKQFERAMADRIGLPYASATNSGTSALHLSLMALAIGSGDEVIMPSFVCTALLNAVRYVGAIPVIADIRPTAYNIDPDDVIHRITPHTKAIIVPHMFGLPAEAERLAALGIPLIEDCAQTLATFSGGQAVGTFGDLSVFSFYATKVMTTGEGGMVLSRSRDLMDRIENLKAYDEKTDNKIRYNYKMTDVAAAMGLVQLSHLDRFIDQRKKIAEAYLKAFDAFGIKLPPRNNGHIFFRFVIETDYETNRVLTLMSEAGVGAARPVFRPLHRYLGLTGYPVTERAFKKSVSIPIYPDLSAVDVEYIANTVKKTMDRLKGSTD
jgi:dTDP-4-amino-4,6-dideoxygalactose transaminase